MSDDLKNFQLESGLTDEELNDLRAATERWLSNRIVRRFLARYACLSRTTAIGVNGALDPSTMLINEGRRQMGIAIDALGGNPIITTGRDRKDEPGKG